MTFEAWGNRIKITAKGRTRIFRSRDPLLELKKCLKDTWRRSAFKSVAAGYFSYDCGRYFEKIPPKKPDSLGLPDIAFGVFENVKQVKIQTPDLEDNKAECIQATQGHLSISPDNNRRYYARMAARSKTHIASGDIYQINLSHRISFPYAGSAARLYSRLCRINPSPYSCLLEYGDFSIISCSPELLLRVTGDQVETRPIAGTRPRGRTFAEDSCLKRELYLSPKERAEHIMLVDLERNDLGRVCRAGSVSVSERMVLESYSHVTHIVSNVKGRLLPGKDGFDALRAIFPGGTISGCPKIRCMEIINELEPHARGIFYGSAGWITGNGDMEFNLLIRTIVLKNKQAHIQVGSGIVADSIPEKEYEETMHKAQAMLEAITVL